MTSKEIEDLHKSTIDKILLDSGIECERVIPESIQEEAVEEEEEDVKEEIPEIRSEEIEAEQVETVSEEVEVTAHRFPTPSLRRLLPDKIRKLEPFNQLHVLPYQFKNVIDPECIPTISLTPPKAYIDILAEIVGCDMYKSSLAEYWFLDTLANILRRSQEDLLDKNAQAVLILWFCEWMKEMQHFDAADRKRMMRRFEEVMLLAAEHIAEECKLPAPSDIGVHYQEADADDGENAQSRHLITFENGRYSCSLMDLSRIIHYIFDLFSSDYQFDLVRSVFCTTPQYKLIDAPYQIQLPKSIYVPPKDKGKKPKTPKKEKSSGKKGKGKIEVLPEDYIALMELKEKEEKELLEIAEREKEEWLRKSSILPLNFAATDEIFDKYWPPPPPPEVTTQKGKAPKKGKK